MLNLDVVLSIATILIIIGMGAFVIWFVLRKIKG